MKDQNHLLMLLHCHTTSTITHLNFWLKLRPLGLYRFTLVKGGQASDKFITRDKGFFDLLERDDDVMADRGFQIQEDLLLHFLKIGCSTSCRSETPNDKV